MHAPHTNKILVTVASGFLGYNLCRFLQQRHEVYGTFFSHPLTLGGCRSIMLDITDRSQVFHAIAEVQPSCIIHTAALSLPDVCEREQSRAWNINVEGTRTIVAAAQKCGSRIVYISTDMVFDGTRGNYRETDVPKPVNFYGTTKLEGEQIVLSGSDNCIVIRITLQYGYGHAGAESFSDWLLKNLKASRPSPLFSDQYRTLTYVFDTAYGLELAALNTEHASVYHLTGPERIDRYAFGKRLVSIFNFPENLLVKSQMSDVPSFAPRPIDVSLIGEKFYQNFNFRPKAVLDGLKAMHNENNP